MEKPVPREFQLRETQPWGPCFPGAPHRLSPPLQTGHKEDIRRHC